MWPAYDAFMIAWECVIDDGSRPFGPWIAIDQRRPLRIVICGGETISIRVTDPVGGVVVLGDQEFLVLNARTLCLPSRQLFTVRSTPSGYYHHKISISSDSTKNLIAQRALFDLWAVRQSGRINLIPLSELVISGSALGNNYL